MDLDRLFGGDPITRVPSHGRPAACLGNTGLASYEDVNQRVLILDAVVAVASVLTGWVIATQRYQSLCEEFSEGFVAVASRRQWRPILHQSLSSRTWVSLGSQHELLWRRETAGLEWREQTERAKKTLLANLTEHQRLEVILTNKFTVIGGKTGNTYRVEVGNGFESVIRSTHEVLLSYCLHPEYWMPHEAVALSTKFLLEDPATEEGVLNRAGIFPRAGIMRALMLELGRPKQAAKYKPTRKPTRWQRFIADMERELLR